MSQLGSNSASRQVVSFRLGDEEYGVDILCVQEIIRVPRITHIPNAPSFVEGVLNLRGKVIPVIALRRRLGLAEAEPGKDTRIVVAEHSPNTLGFIVDSVSEVIRIPIDQIEPPPETDFNLRAEPFVEGVAKLEGRLLMILSLARLLTTEETAALAA